MLNALFFGANGHAPDKIHRQDFQTMLMKMAFDPSLFLHTVSAFSRTACLSGALKMRGITENIALCLFRTGMQMAQYDDRNTGAEIAFCGCGF